LRLIITIAILLLFDWYAFQAFVLFSESWSSSMRMILYSIYWLVPLTAIGTLIAATFTDSSKWNKEVFSILRAILFAAYFGKFLIVILLAVDDLRRLLLEMYQAFAGSTHMEISRSKVLSQVAVFTGSIPFFMLTYGILRNRFRYTIFNEVVKLDKLPEALEGLKIVQISDIHSGSFTSKEPLKTAIDLINQQKADLVFFTGDLVNTTAREMEPYIDVFDKIKSTYGIFSITGNHDYGDYARWESPEAKKQNFDHFIDTHRKLGWNLLLNEHRILDIKGENIAIIGVENYSASPRFSKYGNLSQAYEGSENAGLKLLLSHDPTHWDYEVIKQFKDIAITFSGHTHGMQFGIEIPGWIKWSPAKYVYKEWAGLYKSGEQYLYVNRGFGFLGYPGRVGILPEITVMKLERK
jgi:predicted MPP superfamily phosphohydrolase